MSDGDDASDFEEDVLPPRILILAGAGASRELGSSTPMPLMTDWCDSLVKELDGSESGLAKAAGLEHKMSGERFEAQLGRFLEFQTKLPLVEQFGQLGMATPTTSETFLDTWLNRARNRTSAAVEVIRKNLYQSFGYHRIDAKKAVDAYSELRGALSSATDDEPHFWFATTNYDVAIELAMCSLGFTVRDGFDDANAFATPVLKAQGTVEWALQSNSHSLVLHLHGAVGWYRSGDAIRRHQPDLPYNSTLGTPALLLPDDAKTSTSFDGAEDLWNEFDRAIDEASHLFVLGHSLNDRHIVERLREAGKPLAVSIHSELTGPERDALCAHVTSQLPGARTVDVTFGPNPTFDSSALATWLSS